MGSGKYLKRAQKKNGIENFTKEILFVYDNPEDMYAKEAEIVNEDFLTEENTYNLKVGGSGGWDLINKNNLNGFSNVEVARKGRIAADEKLKAKYGPNWRSILAIQGVTGLKLKIEDDPDFLKRKNTRAFLGKTHSEDAKKRIGSANKISQLGSRNSQFGTKWIYNPYEKVSKRVPKDMLVPEGWLIGRKIKF